MNILFDVLLTEDGDRSPHAHAVFVRLEEMGHDVYLWSSPGGSGHATHVAWVLKLRSRNALARSCK